MEYVKIEKEEIERILENHKHYLDQDCKNWQSMRADFSNVNLSGIDLSDINLKNANLYNANLYKTDLSYANLENVNLYNACLYKADLSNSNLSGAYLENANLYNACLRNANLYGSILKNAKLDNADLCFVDLTYSNLYKASLKNARLKRANLSFASLAFADLSDSLLMFSDLTCVHIEGANLSGAHLEYAVLDKVCGLPDYYKGKILTQDIIGYKKCRYDTVVTLKIPRGSIVFSINGTKCRTNKVMVLAIEDFDGNKVDRAMSTYKHMSYYVGDEITDYSFNCQYNIECSNGIHFFRTKEEAKDYD